MPPRPPTTRCNAASPLRAADVAGAHGGQGGVPVLRSRPWNRQQTVTQQMTAEGPSCVPCLLVARGALTGPPGSTARRTVRNRRATHRHHSSFVERGVWHPAPQARGVSVADTRACPLPPKRRTGSVRRDWEDDASRDHLRPQGGQRERRPARHEQRGDQVLPKDDKRNGLGARSGHLRHDQRIVRRRHLVWMPQVESAPNSRTSIRCPHEAAIQG